MAQIRRNDKQLNALRSIESELRQIEIINDFVSQESGVFEIIYKNDSADKGKGKKIELDAAGKDAAKLKRIFQDIKKAKVKKIDREAKKYQIDLTDDEIAIMLDPEDSEPERTNSETLALEDGEEDAV